MTCHSSHLQSKDQRSIKRLRVKLLVYCALVTGANAIAQKVPEKNHKVQDAALVHLTSTPTGADIEIDGTFRGNTPSDLTVTAGQHVIKMTLSDQNWNRIVQITSGEISLHADFSVVKSDNDAPAGAEKASESRERAVDALRAIVERIKSCPSEPVEQHQWGKDPQDQERINIGPPRNVLWDISASDSLRAPYVAYIQYRLETHSDPLGTPEKHMTGYFRYWAFEKQFLPDREYRYEFDVRSGGLELRNSLSRPASESTWKDDQVPGRCWGDVALGKELKAVK